MRARWLLPALALAACESATLPERNPADVYDFRLDANPPLVLRWPSGSTVRVYVASTDATRRPVLRSALQAGLAEWNRHALFGEYRLAETTELSDADVVLRWTDEASPVIMTGCPPASVRAVTTFCVASEDLEDGLAIFPLSGADEEPSRVKMIVTILPSQAAIPGRVQMLVTHELGHVLGIGGHSADARDLMYEQELTTSVLSRRDLATIRLLYQLQPQLMP